MQYLNVRKTHVNDQTLQVIGQINGLKTLNLRNCFNITDNGLSVLSQLQNLTDLDLTWTNAGDMAIAVASSLKKLQKLTVANCYGITEEGFEPLAQCTSLCELNISSTHATNKTMKAVSKIKTLQELSAYCDLHQEDQGYSITAQGYEAFIDHPSLSVLNLCFNAIDDETLASGCAY